MSKRTPFDFSTYCEIMQNTTVNVVEKDFKAKADEIRSTLGDEIFDVLSTNPYTENILLHSANFGTLLSSCIVYVANKSPAYKKAEKAEKPLVFLNAIVPFWYKAELGTEYFATREQTFKKLGLPLDVFLKLETYEGFRKVAPNIKKASMKKLVATLEKLQTDFTYEDICKFMKAA